MIFGTPVFAGVDGEVISCWREYPDWDEVSYSKREGTPYQDNKHRQTTTGNNIVIKTDDGHTVVNAHLQSMTIPKSLCPNTSSDGWLTKNPYQNKTGSFVTEMLVPAGQRAQIVAGQAIGRVGHSGNSYAPHLHIHVKELVENNGVFTVGQFSPIEWEGVWYQPKSGEHLYNWKRLDGKDLDVIFNAEGKLLLLPGYEVEGSLAAAPHAADYNGDGADDLMCFNVGSGNRRVDLADNSQTGLWPEFNGTNLAPPAWCAGQFRSLHRGGLQRRWPRRPPMSQPRDWRDCGRSGERRRGVRQDR